LILSAPSNRGWWLTFRQQWNTLIGWQLAAQRLFFLFLLFLQLQANKFCGGLLILWIGFNLFICEEFGVISKMVQQLKPKL
jgi:hypothetical protein